MNSIKAKAIVLKKVDFSETSQVARMITDNSGKISVIARGSRRLKSSFGGALDYLNVYEVFFVPKSPDTLDILTYSSVTHAYRNVRHYYDRFAVACHCLYLCDLFCIPAVAQPDLFDLTRRALELLDQNEGKPQSIGLSYSCQMLKSSGYAPRLTECGSCRTRTFERSLFLVPASGGVVCRRCVPQKEHNFELELADILALKKLFDEKFPTTQLKNVHTLFESVNFYMQFVSESRIKTTDHVRQVYRG